VAQKLQIHRQTVARYLRLARRGTIDPDGATNGVSKSTQAPLGTNSAEDSKSSRAPAGNFGQKSRCEVFRTIIEAKVQPRLTAQRIWQDLNVEQGLTGSYDSVKRLVRRLGRTIPLPFRRMECDSGEEAQVDFGKGAPVRRPGGRMKSPHLFRMILSFSRKGYSEVVWRQDTETFLRCLENAFHSFGGVPKTIIVDNL